MLRFRVFLTNLVVALYSLACRFVLYWRLSTGSVGARFQAIEKGHNEAKPVSIIYTGGQKDQEKMIESNRVYVGVIC